MLENQSYGEEEIFYNHKGSSWVINEITHVNCEVQLQH